MEQAYRFGEKLVTPEIIETVMAPDLNALVPTLTRHGYNEGLVGTPELAASGSQGISAQSAATKAHGRAETTNT
jgi:hypothetical protein